MSEATREIMSRLERVERALERLPAEPRCAGLIGEIGALREALELRQRLEREERRQLGHDLRVPLNAIAGWIHILRADAAAASGAVARAVDVFDRNVRALTHIVAAYTAEADGR